MLYLFGILNFMAAIIFAAVWVIGAIDHWERALAAAVVFGLLGLISVADAVSRGEKIGGAGDG